MTKVDTDRRVASIKDLVRSDEKDHPYNFLVAASGLRRVFPVVPQSLTRKQYILEASNHVNAMRSARHGVVVIGGGAVGIEMAAELKHVHPDLQVTLIHSRNRLLSSEPLPCECGDVTLRELKDIGVQVCLSHRVVDVTTVDGDNGEPLQKLTFLDGTHMLASHAISAISRSVPTSSYLPASALDLEGLVKIDDT